MKKIISSDIVVAYFHCPRKAFLLMSGEQGAEVEYISILNEQRNLQKTRYINDIKPTTASIQISKPNDLRKGGNILENVKLKSEHFEARCDILIRDSKTTSPKNTNYEPTVFIGTHNIGKEHKIELAFVGHVLGKIEGQVLQKGTIINVSGKKYGVNLKPLLKSLPKIVSPLQEWLSLPASHPPPIILNKHCFYCPFQKSCKAQAEETDNLSQLSGMNVRMIKQYEKKGIFTIKQLSYLFKPRRLKKQARNHQKTHKPELRALAIRTGKIYIQELPNFSRQNIELFIDIEGVPDQSLYYLFGLLVRDEGKSIYYPFWADVNSDESCAWKKFIGEIEKYPNAPIYHYGNYDSKAIATLSKRYEDINNIKERLVNINSQIYGKVYFPVNSNGLKEIGGFIGANWSLSNSTGVQSLVWRYMWEISQDIQYKDHLLTYNKDDCLALMLLTDYLSKIKDTSDSWADVDFVSKPKRNATESGKQIHDHFETVLKFAHNNYDEKKIKFRRESDQEGKVDKPRNSRKLGYQGQRRVSPKATKTIRISSIGQFCPKDDSQLQTRRKTAKELVSKRLIIDLVLIKGGIKKTITEYIGEHGYCPKCLKSYAPKEIRAFGANQLYGHGFQSWIIYQRIALHMTYNSIGEVVAEQFGEYGFERNVGQFIKNISLHYKKTEELIIQKLLESTVIHADETPINIRGKTQYVWTFTNDEYVVFKLTKTRESTIAHEFLQSYTGTLVSDFYPGYDAIKCKQQKCWVHLIRDLNDDLWESPFDTEFENLVHEIRLLIISIMEAVQKYGLKKRHLHKFMKQVDLFYKKAIIDKEYKSELADKYQKRFIKYKDSLFTFLQYDGIPWHNNTAERALRHLTKQQQISLVFHEQVTHDYLRLLGIRQTLKFQGKSFYRFLFSNETDINQEGLRQKN
jgi:predicted RecB family nuclease